MSDETDPLRQACDRLLEEAIGEFAALGRHTVAAAVVLLSTDAEDTRPRGLVTVQTQVDPEMADTSDVATLLARAAGQLSAATGGDVTVFDMPDGPPQG